MKYYVGNICSSSDYLEHYGAKGMKWGVRRYQNPDGTLTEAGKLRYYGEYSLTDRMPKTSDKKMKEYLLKSESYGDKIADRSAAYAYQAIDKTNGKWRGKEHSGNLFTEDGGNLYKEYNVNNGRDLDGRYVDALRDNYRRFDEKRRASEKQYEDAKKLRNVLSSEGREIRRNAYERYSKDSQIFCAELFGTAVDYIENHVSKKDRDAAYRFVAENYYDIWTF